MTTAPALAALLTIVLTVAASPSAVLAATDPPGPPGRPRPDVVAPIADRPAVPNAAAPTEGWERPVPGAVTHPFDPPAEDWLPGHRGVDLAASDGAEVRSPAPGVVTFAGAVAGKPVVVVTHPDGLRSTFEPVVAAVERGATVGRGDVVGRLAAAPGHCDPERCLHWGVLRGEAYLDPLVLLGEGAPIVLLPGGP